jgi:cell division septum initiation protein DivIVA
VTTSSDPEQIRQEIERTQAALSQDVDALTEKVTPGKIVERRVDRAKDAATRIKEKVMGTTDSGHGGYGGHGGGGVQAAASQTADRVSGVASQAADRVSGTASAAASQVQGAASTAVGAVQDVASNAAGAVQHAPQALKRQARGNPLAAGLIAFGTGWLVSSLLPASRRERELADQARHAAQENLQPVVAQVAGEVKENLAGPAQQAVESVKSTAQDAKDAVTEHGRVAAQDVSGRAQGAAGNVRSTTSS